MPSPTVPEILRAAADTFEQRNKLYGDNYKEVGPVLQLMLSSWKDACGSMGEQEWNRLCVFLHCFNKLTRYAQALNNGEPGHKDSAHDLIVYAAMLEELTS